MNLQSRFLKSLLHSGCIPVGSRVLVAVSGGADSVALLSLLHHIAGKMSLTLEVAHLDHALRDASVTDAAFVEQLCLALHVPFIMERRDVAEIARQKKGNLEEVARDERRHFLLATAQARSCQLVALGHHADDQVETLLMRLLRGSGPSGLAGMRTVDGPVVRPLLSFRRGELLAYLQIERLAWREDESNLDQHFTRNRVRHELLPVLESYNPNVRTQLSSLSEQLRQDNDFWVALTKQELSRCGKWQGQSYVLDRSLLLGMDPALTGRVIREGLRMVRGDLRGIAANHVASVLCLLADGPPQGELNLSGAWVARRYDSLLICRQKPAGAEFFAIVLPGPGAYRLPDGRTVRLSLEERVSGESVDAVEFAAASLPFPLQLRCCRAGDRLRPSGMSGTKKLQDLFVDLKIVKEERQKTLLLVKDDEVLWVAGLRRCEGRRPAEGTPVLRIVMEP